MLIVVGVDDSDTAWRAVAYAVGLAQRQHSARVVFVHIASSSGAVSPVPEVIPYARQAHRSARTMLLDRLGRAVGDAGLDWELRVVVGNRREGVQIVADEVGADLIIVGGSRRSRRPGRSLGVDLARRGRWPVLIIP
jgi:nucleotide-binding universal stress UspA family protein